MSERINSVEDLERVRKAAEAQGGSSPVDYKAWKDDMEKLQELGIKSTGSASGDRAKLKQTEDAAAQMAKEAQMQVQQQQQAQHNTEDKDKAKDTPSDQKVKEAMAAMRSQEILSQYAQMLL